MATLSMLMPVSGTFNIGLFLDGRTLTQQTEVILQCDTSSAPVIINLPKIGTFFGGQLAFRVKVNDVNNNAGTNTITINTFSGDFFVGTQTQFIINGNGASVEVIMVGTNRWTVLTASAQLPIYSTQITLTPTNILALNSTVFTLVGGISNKTIKLVSLVSTMNFNSIAYAMGGVFPAINIAYGTTSIGIGIIPASFITSGVSVIKDSSFLVVQVIDNTIQPLSVYKGANLNFKASDAITLGNSSIVVDLQYMIIG